MFVGADYFQCIPQALHRTDIESALVYITGTKITQINLDSVQLSSGRSSTDLIGYERSATTHSQ